MVFFRFLTSACDRGKPLHKDDECLKAPVFSSILVPSALSDLTTLRTHHSEKHRLENTVCFRDGPNTGKKKPYTTLLQCRTFLCRKKRGSTEERFRWWIWFSWFYKFLVSTTGLESFSLGPEKFSKRFSFGGGCVHFFLLCKHNHNHNFPKKSCI